MGLSAEPEGLAGLDIPSLFDASPDMLCIRDLQGRFVKLNQAWETTLGHSVGELEGAALLPLIHPEDVMLTRSRMTYADLDGEIMGFVNRYRRRDGGYRHLEWRARRVGGVVFGVARDVTDRLAFEAKLRAAADARRELLAEMDQELRKSLNGVVDLVSALGWTDLSPAQQDMIQRIAASSATLDRLVSALDASSELARVGVDMAAFDALGSVRCGRGDPDGAPSPPVVDAAPHASAEGLRSGRDFQHAVRRWALDTLGHFDACPVYYRSFRDFPSEVLGVLAIHLANGDGLHQRGLQTLGAQTGFISAGRTAALMLRMQDIQFIEPAEAFRTGRARRYRPLPIMVTAFAERALVDLRSAALNDPAIAALVEPLAQDARSTDALLCAYAEVLLEESTAGNAAVQRPLNGVRFMAMGKLIALSVAAEAMERHGETWEGPLEIALASYARRFEVSRAHVRRVLQTLEPCGLARVEGHPHRRLVTGRFRESIEAYYAAVFETTRRAIDRLRAAGQQTSDGGSAGAPSRARTNDR